MTSLYRLNWLLTLKSLFKNYVGFVLSASKPQKINRLHDNVVKLSKHIAEGNDSKGSAIWKFRFKKQ